MYKCICDYAFYESEKVSCPFMSDSLLSHGL